MKHHQITYHTVPRETFLEADELVEKHRNSLETYLDQLIWWNQRMNLVSRDVPRETLWEHIRHSLLLCSFEAYKSHSLIIDAGTGGGLPGVPLSIISPEKRIVMNDIVSKKVLAVKQMAKQLGLENVRTADGSVEKLGPDLPFLLVSKHAFKIHELFRYTRSLPWDAMVFYKGLAFENELKPVDTPLEVDAYDLYKHTENTFYKDKALVFVRRK